MIRLAAGVAAAKAVGTLARTAGRGGGTSLPGKVLTRVEPRAIGQLARRLERGSVVISATNGKTTTAAMVASILERTGARLVHNRAGANMAGGIASALANASRRGGRALTGDFGLFEVDEFWLGAGRRGGRAARDAARQPVPRPARPLRRAGDDRRPLGGDRGRARRARAQRRRPARRRPRPRTRPSPVYFGVDDDSLALPELQHASDSKHCRRCGHAYTYEAVYLAHLGHYRCPNCGQERPEPAVVATDVELRGIRSAAFTLRDRRVELPLPGLYNVYNALGAAALTLSLGVPLDDVVAGLEAVEPAFGRAETLDLNGRPASILLVKNPAGANEVLRTLALEDGELDLLGVLNDRTADGRDVSWVWDADWELLLGRVRRMTCSGTRAAELALRMKYAGLETDRLHVVDDLEAGARRGARRRRGSALHRPDLHRAARTARAAHAPRPREGVLAMSAEFVMWHEVECGRYDADLPLWHELAREAPRGRARRRRGHRARRAAAGRRGPRGHRARRGARAARRARGARGRPPASRSRRCSPTPPRSTSRAPSGSSPCRCRPSNCCPSATGSSPARAARSCPAGASRWRSRPTSSPTTARRRCPRRTSGSYDGWTYVSQPIAIRIDDGFVHIERTRRRIGPHGEQTTEDDVIRLCVVTPGGLAEEAAAHGLEAEELRHIPETFEHVASQVVVFRG